MNFNLQQQMTGDMRFGDRPFMFQGRVAPLYPAYALCWALTLAAGIAALVIITLLFGGVLYDSLSSTFGPILVGDTGYDEQWGRSLAAPVIFVVFLYLFIAIAYPAIWSLYSARELALFANYTSFGSARFNLDATAPSLIGLSIGNMLIMLLTLGIGAPFVQQRLVRYLCDRMTIEGKVEIDSIRQSTAAVASTGEGLADAFDIGGM